MYSTKLLNSQLVPGNAYITVGDPYQTPNQNPFRNAPKLKKDEKPSDPFRTTRFPKNAENGMFTKLEYKGGDVEETITYLKTQPIESRKNGFGSHDAKRKDEFSSSVRTEQFRGTIKKENQILKHKFEEDFLKYADTINNESSQSEDHRIYQFDVVNRDTDFDPKQKRDTFYKTGAKSGSFSRPESSSLGFRPMSAEWGKGVDKCDYHPPEHGGHTATSCFYDKSHIR